jgi:hypothetical protein
MAPCYHLLLGTHFIGQVDPGFGQSRLGLECHGKAQGPLTPTYGVGGAGVGKQGLESSGGNQQTEIIRGGLVGVGVPIWNAAAEIVDFCGSRLSWMGRVIGPGMCPIWVGLPFMSVPFSSSGSHE